MFFLSLGAVWGIEAARQRWLTRGGAAMEPEDIGEARRG
jgi:hypothetical protein